MSHNKMDDTTFLQLAELNDSYPYDTSHADPLYRLYLPNDDRPHGFLVPAVVEKIPWTTSFRVVHEKPRRVDVLDGSNGNDTAAACTKAFAELIAACQEQNILNLKTKYQEDYLIVGAEYPVRLFRFAAPLFGIISRGAHLTVYTQTSNGMKIWVPRRSPTLFTYPNKLDTTVAGGVSAEHTPFETIVHEADEEASLPESLVRRDLRSVGLLTYISSHEQGGVKDLFKPDMIYVYDMEVGEHFVPKPNDDEVKEFYLMTIDEIKTSLRRKEFKTNSAAVMIDFLIRHGIITAENEPDYAEIQMRLHRALPFATAPRLRS